jgi:hypothetical protein
VAAPKAQKSCCRHEKKNAAGKSVASLKMLAKRKHSRRSGRRGNSKLRMPQLPQYFYATPLENNRQTRKHQRCGGMSQVLVQYHAVH